MTDLGALVDQAARIAWQLRDEDPRATWAELDDLDQLTLKQLCCALAAMVDVDRTPAELLEWTGAGAQTRLCAHCERQFTPTRRRPYRYCSEHCREAATNARARWVSTCLTCASPIHRATPTSRDRYCSEQCVPPSRRPQWRAAKARKKTAASGPSTVAPQYPRGRRGRCGRTAA